MPEKKSKSPGEELRGFDDVAKEPLDAYVRTYEHPAKKSGKASGKGEALPDFSEEDDRSSVLPSVEDDLSFVLSDEKRGKTSSRASEKKEPEKPKEERKGSAKKESGAAGKKASSAREESAELVPSKPKEAIKAERRSEKKSKTSGKKSSRDVIDVKDTVKPKTTSDSAKTIFIVSMCLLAPFALLLVLAIVLLFAFLFTAAILLAGVLALALVILVVAGVVLALTGITYGLIQMVSKSGFSFYAGQYELGLGLAITGITLILASLLYAGATAFVPFIVKQLGRLIKFLAKKIKEFFKKIYRYSTQL